MAMPRAHAGLLAEGFVKTIAEIKHICCVTGIFLHRRASSIHHSPELRPGITKDSLL